jgi:hypothetical protein
VRAMLVGVEDECRAELRGERGEGAARLRALLERARVVAEEEIDLAAAGEALQGGPLVRGGPVPVATGSRRSGGERAAVGETAQATKTEACPGRQVVQAEAERHPAEGGSARAGERERLGVVVVSVHEQQLEARAAEHGTSGAEEAAPFRLARQVAEVAERDERVAALLDGALDQAAQVASVAMQVAEDKQPAHSRRAYFLCLPDYSGSTGLEAACRRAAGAIPTTPERPTAFRAHARTLSLGVWFLWEDGAVWIIGSLRDDSFPRRVERESRCAIGIVDFDVERGLVQRSDPLQPGDGGRSRSVVRDQSYDLSE